MVDIISSDANPLRASRFALRLRHFQRLTLAVFALAALVPMLAAAEPLEVTTIVNKVVPGENGKEQLLPADRVDPGSVLLYQATYHNVSERTLREVQALLPIPPGLTYAPDSAHPAAREASVDGKTFFPLTNPPEKAPLATWRALRWAPRDLKAGASFVIELRAVVVGPAR